jgi:transposase-like protein
MRLVDLLFQTFRYLVPRRDASTVAAIVKKHIEALSLEDGPEIRGQGAILARKAQKYCMGDRNADCHRKTYYFVNLVEWIFVSLRRSSESKQRCPLKHRAFELRG